MTTNAHKPLPMTPQQLADARKEVDLEDVTVVLSYQNEYDENDVVTETIWNVFAYAPSLAERTELIALYDENFTDRIEAREIAYALSDNFECQVVVLDEDGDSNILEPGERPTWMAPEEAP